ncbi:DUF924 domain-containing protein [Brevundimonas naejangsanensis]|uniref:DUF924 domain-containing protein n=1 Tax=Brevundimonas naejangsanensis TaxID=588932 RepID=A0A494RQ96_9CAUL|nr:DUF924 family protein [Brevundimonas naejangsanensis]AYG95704.1 DUF924 domain-containing protein [Brevundimonas naejangsanensis]
MTQLLPPSEILTFWTDAGPDKWFAKDAAFDRAFTDRCCDTHYAAARRELDHWAQTPQGALALIILLDQLPRNAFRDTGHMFATDPLALMFAKEAIQRGDDRKVAPQLRPFVLMPLMHSESLTDQELLLTLLDEAAEPDTYKFALIHRDIIARFGRFPHRNPCLGRETTPEEADFLKAGGFSG